MVTPSPVITIPWGMPTLNKLIDLTKSHWSRYSRVKREWTEAVALCAKAHRPKMKFRGRVSITFTYYAPNKRIDPDNISSVARKFILDGLTKADVITDDSWKIISGLNDIYRIDKNNPRIEVAIEEA